MAYRDTEHAPPCSQQAGKHQFDSLVWEVYLMNDHIMFQNKSTSGARLRGRTKEFVSTSTMAMQCSPFGLLNYFVIMVMGYLPI